MIFLQICMQNRKEKWYNVKINADGYKSHFIRIEYD
jgi:hypothetical protein